MSDWSYLIELPEIYDGWSIGVTKSGEYVNRWEKSDPRHAPTQATIDQYMKGLK